jgi:hypothetical protein
MSSAGVDAASQAWFPGAVAPLFHRAYMGCVSDTAARGGCLCGAVRYEVRGPLRDVLICHCEECRRWHGHVSASTAAARADLVIRHDGALRWIDSPRSDAAARRGFCGECGSSLFWDAPDRDTVSIAAGTLDGPTGLRVMGEWYVEQAGDYYVSPAPPSPPRSPRAAP